MSRCSPAVSSNGPESMSHHLPIALRAPHRPVIDEALGLELEARQRLRLGQAHVDAQALVRLGELAAQLGDERVALPGCARALDEHLDLVASVADRVEVDLELVDA